MASEAGNPSELGVLGPNDSMGALGVPQPLHIVKRCEARPSDVCSRKSSANTDDSLASMPESPSMPRVINVYKKRRYGCMQAADMDGEDESSLLSAQSPSSQWDKTTSSSSSFLTETIPMAEANTSTSSLALSSASPVKSISSISRGKYLLKKAINGLDKDRSKRHKSNSRPATIEPFRLHASSPTKSCHDLRGAVSFPPRDSFNLERHLHESIMEEGFHGRDACVLAPQVVVTPEVKALDDGNVDLWVAVQIFGKLCRARDSPEGEAAYEDATCHRSTYGHLYNLKIDILPTANSTILEVIGNSETARTLHLNSRALILVHLSLSSSSPPDLSIQLRHRSEELMADLEFHLGSIRTEYLVVKLTYSHSTFPDVNNTSMTDGVAIVNNKIVTLATAVIKRHNSSSLWSPPPAPTSNPLFEIISSHWGPLRTADLVGRIAGHARSTPRKIRCENTPTKRKGDLPLLDTENNKLAKKPQIPVRRTSLKQIGPAPLSPQTPGNSGGSSRLTIDEDEEDGDEDPARKIWTEMRKASRGTAARMGMGGSFRVTKNGGSGARPISPSLARIAAGGRLSPKSARRPGDADKRREALLERAVRNRRSLGGETLRSLVPSLEDMKIGVEQGNGGERRRERRKDSKRVSPPVTAAGSGTGSSAASRRRQFSTSSTRKRMSLGWGWGGWWS